MAGFGEAHFYGSEERVHIRFPSPYLRNEPTPVEIERMDGDELHVTRFIASYEEAFKLESQYGVEVFASEDAKEGPRAFAEKRKPNFQGR